jgi:serine/threonine protein kinase
MRTCPKCQRTYPDDMDFCPRDATGLVSVATATESELQTTLAQRFRIVRRLGGGGMGSVFLAEQIGVGNRPVALKVLLRKLLDDPEFLLRFRNEAASTGRIDHPNVVTIYESGQADDGTPYIAMQYLEGESLKTRLKSRGALPVEECAAIIQQAARGLNAAHKLGIIHRDLKPDNIFLTFADEDVGAGLAPPSVAPVSSPAGTRLLVKIVDFGIAKLRESATHTLTGTVLGTPAYMSFEQASGMKSEELDAHSDIYSLGVVAYEMLTGRVPFHSDTPLGYVRKHLSEEPPPFRAVKPELAVVPQLEQVVMKALAKNRDARYGSVLEFARQFAEAARAPDGADARTSLSDTKLTRPSDAELGQRGAVAPRDPAVIPAWVGVPLFVLLLGLGGWWYVSSAIHERGGSPPPSSTETHRPSDNPPVINPQGESATPQTGAGQQRPVVETPAATSPSPTKSETNAADRRKQVEKAKRQGDTYYDNGEYDNAINSYQSGLKLDPSSASLRKALRRAQTAKAAEEKFNQ